MNFIDIVRAAAVDVGIANAPASVGNAEHDVARLVRCVQDEYETLQERLTWAKFLRVDFMFWTVANISQYDASTAQNPVRDWVVKDPVPRIWDTDTEIGHEGFLCTDIDWAEFQARYRRGAERKAKPAHACVDPQGRLCFGPTPDKGTQDQTDGYRIRGECYRAAGELVADTDAPLFDFGQKLLVHGAVMRFSERDSAWDNYKAAKSAYDQLYPSWHARYSPDWEMAEPMF